MSEPTNPTEFESFKKIPRLSREIVITEKIDGTNAQILIVPSRGLSCVEELDCVVPGDRMNPNAMTIFAGSRNRWIQPGNDNFGFAAWVKEHAEELLKLGPGRHFGEWFGSGIQRGYGLKEKRFALFNVNRWVDVRRPVTTNITSKIEQCPECCTVVPVLYTGPFCTGAIHDTLLRLTLGSVIAPGFTKPEGIVIYHKASGCLFKKTFEHDSEGKETS